MRIFLALLACVFPLMSFGQGLKLTSMTTNLTMNQPINAGVPVWNDTAKRWSNAVVTATATNAIANGHGLGTNTSFFGSFTNNGTLRQVGASEFVAGVVATNGNILMLNDGFNATFGVIGGLAAITNNAIFHQRATWLMNDSGISAAILDGAFLGIENGGHINIGVNPAGFGTTATKIQFGTNDYIVSLGATDNSEIQRYRFYNDNSGNESNLVQRKWEVEALIDASSGSPAGNSGELQFNTASAFAANTNLTWEFGTVNPTLVIGKALYTSGQPYLELRHANGTNRLRYFGFTTMGATATVGASNDAYRIIIAGDTVSGGQLTPGSEGGWLRSWNGYYGGLVFATNTIHALGGITGASLTSSNVLGAPSLTRWYETNGGFSHVVQAATRMSRSSTNIPGVFEAAAASVLELNTRQQHRLTVTNRMAASTTLVVTNSVPGEEYSVVLIGAVAGGTDYTCTYVPHTGQLARNLDGTNNAPATSISISVPAGSSVEINSATRFGVGTNWHDVVTRKGLGS